MASPLSEALGAVARIEEAARRGDWRTARELADSLAPPSFGVLDGSTRENTAQLARYLERLKEAVVTAKSSRAQAAASLRRVQAAAAFCHARVAGAGDRQKIAASPET
jgi:hypothetical protein